jgi:hypothetical protein
MSRPFRSLAALAAATALFVSAPPALYAGDVRPLAEKKEEEHKGEKKDLGSKEIAGYAIKVTQVGDVKPGEESVFLLVVSGGGTTKPKAIRAWVGVESAEGSAKTKAEDEDKEWHAHVETPKPIPDKSQLWLEVETADGKSKVAFDYRK